MSKRHAFIARYGPEAGPKLYHILQSRAAYKGVSTRRRRRIEALTGRPFRPRRRHRAEPDAGRQAMLFPESAAEARP